jgi:hypothetical protein
MWRLKVIRIPYAQKLPMDSICVTVSLKYKEGCEDKTILLPTSMKNNVFVTFIEDSHTCWMAVHKLSDCFMIVHC